MNDIIWYKDFPCIILDDYITSNDETIEGNHQYKVIYKNYIVWLYSSSDRSVVCIEEDDFDFIEKNWRKWYL